MAPALADVLMKSRRFMSAVERFRVWRQLTQELRSACFKVPPERLKPCLLKAVRFPVGKIAIFTSMQFVLDDLPAFHHELNTFQLGDVSKRIACNCHQVGEPACFN